MMCRHTRFFLVIMLVINDKKPLIKGKKICQNLLIFFKLEERDSVLTYLVNICLRNTFLRKQSFSHCSD